MGATTMLVGVARRGAWTRRIVVTLAAFSAAVALLSLTEWVSGVRLGIDGLLVAGPTHAAGRMDATTAVSVVILAIALTLVLFWRGPGEHGTRRFAEGLALFGLFVGATELIGIVYGVRGVLAPGGTVMAPTTATCLALISVGVVIVAGGPLLHFVTDRLPGSAMARRLLPVSVATIVVLGGLRLAGEHAGDYSSAVGGTLFVMVTIVAICAPIVLAAARVNGAELARRAGALRLAEEEERIDSLRFAELTHSMAQVVHTSLDIDEVVIRAVNRMGPAFEVDRSSVRLLDTDGEAPMAGEWCTPGTVPLSSTVGAAPAASLRPLLRAIVETSRPMVVDDVRTDPRVNAQQRKDLAAVSTRSMLACPVGPNRGEVLGIVTIEQAATRAWTKLETAAVEQIGRDIGVAVSHGRAFELQTQLVAQATEVDVIRSDFVSKVSHELRSPLTSILGYVELLDDESAGTLTPDQGHMLDVIGRNANRLQTLVEDLLTLSRVEAGTFRVQFTKVDVTTAVDQVMQSFAPMIAKQYLDATVSVEAGLAVDADSEQLERMIANLVSNAVKFTPPGGRLEIVAGRVHRDAVLSVTDTGVGVPENEQPKLFQRFFRSTLSQEVQAGGTGLGLFIVKQIVEAHGGTAEAMSKPGVGTTITVRIPLTHTADTPRSSGKEEVRV